MKLLKCITLTVCLALTACGSQIDERQTDVIQGLVYKHGDTDPYTGTVIHSKVTRFQSLVVGDCTLHYTKGVIDGKIECSANNGTKIFETNIADEKRSGTEKHWSPETGELTYQVSWDADIKDGVEKIYDTSGKTLLHQITWAKGVHSGSEKEWDADGKLLTELNWDDGKKSGKQATVNGNQVVEETYKDGLFDGVKKVSDATGVIEETPFKQGVLSGTQTFYRFGVAEVVRKWSDGKVVSESINRHVDKGTVYETDDIQCLPSCAADIDPQGYVRSITMTSSINKQVQLPKIALRHIVSVDQADENLEQDGFGDLNAVAGGAALTKTHVPNTLDFSKIAKLETTIKDDKVDGTQKAYDAAGALILEAQWNEGQWLSARGSWWPSGPADQAGSESQPSQEPPRTNADSDASGALTVFTSATPAGNPSTTQIVIFQYDGAHGPEHAYCADEGEDGAVCHSDSDAQIGRGTYKDFMIPGSKICIEGSAGCIAPRTFDRSTVNG